MEIVYYPGRPVDCLPSVSLTGDAPEEGMQAGNVMQGNGLDIAPLVRAPEPLIRDVGNQTNTFVFTIQRTHETAGAAAYYWLHHLLDLVPAVGRVRFAAQEPGGRLVARLWLQQAGIQGRQGAFDGCCTTFVYTIVGGRLTAEQ